MALISGGLDRLKIKYPDLDIDKMKIIGWGAGQWFRDYFKMLNISISYTICPRVENHDAEINGIKVKSPEILREESNEKTLILIIAAHRNEIMTQIREFGEFKCVHAFDFDVENCSNYKDLQDFQELKSKFNYSPFLLNSSSQKVNKEVAIFHTGPLFDYAELALKYNRLKHPQYYQIIVTWKGEPAKNIEACSKWVDEIIQIESPVNPGISNINYMLRSNVHAVEYLRKHNFEYALRLRTGNILTGSISKYLIENLIEFKIGEKKFGFYCNWSWKNIPFHISDAFMFGSLNDMHELWSIKEDHRLQNLDLKPNSQQLIDLVGNTSETYLWGSYVKERGYDESSLEHYYNFLAEKLLPLEPVLNTISLKHIPAFTIDYDSNLSPTPSWWREVNMRKSIEMKKGLARFNKSSSINDHWQSKIG